jgi:hypothetical protein
MADLAAIRAAIEAGNYRFSQHARRQLSSREITVAEVEAAISRGEVIEDYPDDKYRPSCLILGWSHEGRPLHVQCSHAMPDVIVVTQYEPDPDEWTEDLRRRTASRQ